MLCDDGSPLPAFEGDCVYTTHPRDRYKPVMYGVAGTVTTRAGELAVVVRDVRRSVE